MISKHSPAKGRCTCGDIEYVLNADPVFVHCCHCTWCQRESGAAFAINAMIEATHLQLTKGAVEKIDVPTNSGRGQTVARCPSCKVALWSHYSSAKDKVAFVRVGTLENPNLCPPNLHIFTSTKQTWLKLGEDALQVEEFYKRDEYWPEDSVKRYKTALESNPG